MPRLYHVGITVTDLERSVAFYRDLMGMTEQSRSEAAGEWFDALTWNKGARIRVAFLGLEEFRLQLVQYLAAGGTRLELGHHHIGNPHLSFHVTDLEERHARAQAMGVRRLTAIVRIGATSLRSFYAHDPDGVPVELIESHQ